jgi:hypothetical protein
MGFCGSDIPSTQESASDLFSAIYNYYPKLAEVYRDQALPTAQTELGVSQAVSPAYQQLMNDMYKQFGPQLAQTGQQIDRSNRLAAGQTDVDLLNTSGRQLANTYQDIDKGLNPEYYQVRANEANRIQDLLGSINLNDANPEAERLVGQENARTGNLNNTSATGTVANALSFGSELDKRRNALNTAINSATNFLQPANNSSNFNPATTALSRPTSSTGASEFAGVDKTAGQSAVTSGQNFTNQLAGLQGGYNAAMANKRDVVDRINEGFSSV